MFHPRPARGPGATRQPRRQGFRPLGDVSIPARPAGRALLGSLQQALLDAMFQSPPGRGPGATRQPRRQGFRPLGDVSIPARPAGRALLSATETKRDHGPVSIPRPARGPGATRICHRNRNSRLVLFQSPPGPRAGRYLDAAVRMARLHVDAVSIPARPRRAALLAGHSRRRADDGVSIPARPAGRALRGSFTPSPTARASFNPRPARGPGATLTCSGNSVERVPVSIPARPRAGRYTDREAEIEAVLRKFQSPPGPRAGRYGDHDGESLKLILVSIPARPAGRALRGGGGGSSSVRRVSIPAPPAGRALRLNVVVAGAEVAVFQSPPGPRAGALR